KGLTSFTISYLLHTCILAQELLQYFSNTSPIYLQFISNLSPIHLQFNSNSTPILVIGDVLELKWSKDGVKVE
ncbi:MAG: hypothetical protein IK041_03050, partial [Bacteroidales bacterium]|nr:hypothetical protein [Bacteroidales bacterium]